MTENADARPGEASSRRTPEGITTPSKVSAKRRIWLLERLSSADGPTYEALCHDISREFPHKSRYLTRVLGVRAVRQLLWDGLAVTEADMSIWMTALGWNEASDG